MSRQMKRHHRTRLKKKRRFNWGMDLSNLPGRIGKAVNTPCSCSCWMCGNPRRKHGEQTIQERKSDEYFDEFRN